MSSFRLKKDDSFTTTTIDKNIINNATALNIKTPKQVIQHTTITPIDQNTTLTSNQLLSGTVRIKGVLSSEITLTLPDASGLISAGNLVVGDHFSCNFDGSVLEGEFAGSGYKLLPGTGMNFGVIEQGGKALSGGATPLYKFYVISTASSIIEAHKIN